MAKARPRAGEAAVQGGPGADTDSKCALQAGAGCCPALLALLRHLLGPAHAGRAQGIILEASWHASGRRAASVTAGQPARAGCTHVGLSPGLPSCRPRQDRPQSCALARAGCRTRWQLATRSSCCGWWASSRGTRSPQTWPPCGCPTSTTTSPRTCARRARPLPGTGVHPGHVSAGASRGQRRCGARQSPCPAARLQGNPGQHRAHLGGPMCRSCWTGRPTPWAASGSWQRPCASCWRLSAPRRWSSSPPRAAPCTAAASAAGWHGGVLLLDRAGMPGLQPTSTWQPCSPGRRPPGSPAPGATQRQLLEPTMLQRASLAKAHAQAGCREGLRIHLQPGAAACLERWTGAGRSSWWRPCWSGTSWSPAAPGAGWRSACVRLSRRTSRPRRAGRPVPCPPTARATCLPGLQIHAWGLGPGPSRPCLLLRRA